MKTAYAMPCTTPEQAEEMKKLCEKHGIEITQTINDDFYDRHITNYQNGIKGKVGFINGASKGNCGATLIPYNPALFLYSLGVFPEKWCVRGSSEFVEFARKMNWDLGYIIGYLNQYLYSKEDIYIRSFGNDYYTQNSYIEVPLEDLIKHYEKPKTNDKMKVRITKASSYNWYVNKIGEEFEVKEYDKIDYVLLKNELYLIGKDDCEIVAEPPEQPKWEDRTRGGFEYKIIMEDRGDAFSPILAIVKHLGVWVVKYLQKNGSFHNDKTYSPFDLIPFNPRKTELLAEKEKLQKRVAEIDKELNQ